MTTTSLSLTQGSAGPATAIRFPLTATQLRFWYLEQLGDGSPFLNVAVRWELRGAIRDETIETTLARILDRHEVLRTRLAERGGMPVQEVLPAAEFKLSVVDVRRMPAEAHAEQVETYAVKSAAEPFDLSKPPLFRATLVRTGHSTADLLLTAHHSVFDGFSIGVLGHEFGTIAQALEAGREPDLADLPLQYGDYALWQQDYLASEAVREDLDYWKRQLADLPRFEVPPKSLPPRSQQAEGGAVFADLPAAFGERLEATARSFDMTGFAYTAAVLSAALHKLTAASEVVIGTHVAGRRELDLEQLIGAFINVLVLRFPTAPETSFADHLKAAKRVVQDALAHEDVPFNKVVEAVNPRRHPAGNPLVAISLDMQRTTFLESRAYGQFEIVSRPSHAPGAIYDLNFLLIGRPDSWRLTLEYNARLYDQKNAQAILDQLLATFEVALSNPAVRLADMPAAGTSRDTSSRASAGEAEPGLPETAMPPVSRSGSGTAKELTKVWSEILDLAPDQCDGDFFELGGHSLLVVRMMAQLREQFGVRLGIGKFLANPTLLGCAAAIDEAAGIDGTPLSDGETAAPTWELLTLRTGAPRAPVVVTVNHPVLYRGLKESLGGNATIVNLLVGTRQAIDAQQEMDFDEIVRDGLRCLRSLSPNGPYVLMGLCVNGRVALRLAQELAAAGNEVPLVVMIDSWSPCSLRSPLPFFAHVDSWKRRLRRWSHYLGQGLAGRRNWKEMLGKTRPTSWILYKLGLATPPPEEERLILEVVDHLVAKSRHYSFSNYPGEVLLFKTQASTALAGETMFGWEGTLREDTPVYTVNGWHEDALLRSGLEQVARIVQRRLPVFAREVRDSTG